MGRMRLWQRQNDVVERVFAWQKLEGIYSGSDIETGPMSECVSLIYIGGKDVRGYHAGGSILWANWKEIKSTAIDTPHTKMITVMGHSRTAGSVIEEVLKVIKTWNFQNFQWELYQSSNAIVTARGVVTHEATGQPVRLERVFISKFAPGLDQVVLDEEPTKPSGYAKPKAGPPTPPRPRGIPGPPTPPRPRGIPGPPTPPRPK